MIVPAVSLLTLLLLTGCGVGFGPGGEAGTAELTITRDYGGDVLGGRSVDDLGQASTAMRLLDESAEIETRYGGGFVQSIDGISGSSGSRSSDWFYFVNGIAAERGAAEFVVGPGDRMWWDFRDWSAALNVTAVVGAYPAPMSTGYDEMNWPVRIDCRAPDGPACDLVRKQLESDGVELGPDGPGPEPLRILVGDWAAIRSDPAAEQLDSAPSTSGVFARFSRSAAAVTLAGLDGHGKTVHVFGAGSGLIAATRKGGEAPVWLITGIDADGVRLAAAALGEPNLKDRYAAVVYDNRVASLPLATVPDREQP